MAEKPFPPPPNSTIPVYREFLLFPMAPPIQLVCPYGQNVLLKLVIPKGVQGMIARFAISTDVQVNGLLVSPMGARSPEKKIASGATGEFASKILEIGGNGVFGTFGLFLKVDEDTGRKKDATIRAIATISQK